MQIERFKLIALTSLVALIGLAFFVFRYQNNQRLGIGKFYSSVASEAKKVSENVQSGKLFTYDEAGLQAPVQNKDYLARAKNQNTSEEGTGTTPSSGSAVNPSQQVAGSAGYNLAGEDNPSWGPEGAKVTVVEFSDFLCPYCAEFAKTTLPQLKNQYATRIKFVFRDLPIENIHPLSPRVHEAAECAHKQGKFWELHDLIFANSSRITESFLNSLAEKAGLTMAEFNSCLAGGEAKLKVMENLEAGISAGVSATPTLFVNTRKVEGIVSFEELSRIIDEELNK